MEKKVLEIVEEVNPHLLFLTGDYVTWKGDYEPALQFLSRLEAKFGVWAVMGDYDYSNSRKSCLFCHEQGTGKPTNRHPVKFLRDQMIRVNVNGKAVWIGGVRSEEERTMAAFETRDESNSREPAIILSHSPLRFDLVDKSRDVLVLGGDTHGGQVPLPSWVWKILGYEKNEKYPHGLYEEGKAKLYVSKGVGTSHRSRR